MIACICFTCSRSCTGFGEFVFKAWQSVQITHAIETIVARIKNKCSPTPVRYYSNEKFATPNRVACGSG